MRKRLLKSALAAATIFVVGISSVKAADLSGPPPTFAPPPADIGYNKPWAGFYVGGHLGYGSGTTDLSAPSGSVEFDLDGVTGGLLAGRNWQSGRWVYGLEADVTFTGVEGSGTFGGNTVNAEIDWMASARARLGYAFSSGLMLYGTFGGAVADYNLPVTGTGGGSGDATKYGYQAGLGAEVQVGKGWIGRFEYIYTGLTDEDVTYPLGSVNYDSDIHTFRGALVYKF